jgi:single-stranded DNA-binding protein
MAQITIKGYIATDVVVETVGKNKDKEKVRVTIVDTTGVKNVGFFVDFWGNMIPQIQQFKKGSNVLVKARVEDGSYEKEVEGKKTKIYMLNYIAKEIVGVVDGVEDLDKEFERCKQLRSTHSELTPVDEQMPTFS